MSAINSPNSIVAGAVALLWTAPELLRIPRRARGPEGTHSGDVYSFAIIIYEVCYLLPPYGDKLTSLGAPGISYNRPLYPVFTLKISFIAKQKSTERRY